MLNLDSISTLIHKIKIHVQNDTIVVNFVFDEANPSQE